MPFFSKQKLAMLIAEFFYCGRSKFAPGTIGSLGSLIIWVPALYFFPLYIKILLLAFLFILGLWASSYAIVYYKNLDPKQVVIDEVVGQGIVFLVLLPNWWEVIVAFLLFRLFDIVKPWPIKQTEKSFPKEWGIMLDDVMAAFYALVCCFMIFRF